MKPCGVHFNLAASLKKKPRSYTPYRGKNALSKIMHHTLQHPRYVVRVWKNPLSALSIDNVRSHIRICVCTVGASWFILCTSVLFATFACIMCVECAPCFV